LAADDIYDTILWKEVKAGDAIAYRFTLNTIAATNHHGVGRRVGYLDLQRRSVR